MKLVRILLPISQHGTTEACAAVAFGLAQRSDAQLQALHPCPAPAQRLPYSTELSPLYFEEVLDIGRKQASLEKRQAKKWFDKTAQGFRKVATDLVAVEGLVTPSVALFAKAADLTVLPCIDDKDEGFWSGARDGALFQSGRPMLAVPKSAGPKLGETVVIAWKDAAEAARAVAAAAPFLAAAKQVRLVTVAEEDHDEQSASAVTDYLTRSGFKVEHAHVAQGPREIGEVLIAEASRVKSALLVMGAYGHWRWREWAFGGATLHVLRHTTVPVLMAH